MSFIIASSLVRKLFKERNETIKSYPNNEHFYSCLEEINQILKFLSNN